MSTGEHYSEERPLTRLLLKEARSKPSPREWIGELRQQMESRHIDQRQLLQILEIASEGFRPDNDDEAPAEPFQFNIVTDLDFRTIYPPTLRLEQNAPFKVERYANSVGLCSDVGPRFRAALGAYSVEEGYSSEQNKEGRGIVLFCERRPVAFMKLVGLRSAMAFETVESADGENLLARGVIYALPYQLAGLLQSIDIRGIPEGDWVGVDMESLAAHGLEVSFTPVLLVDDRKVTQALAEHSAQFAVAPPTRLKLSDDDFAQLASGGRVDAASCPAA